MLAIRNSLAAPLSGVFALLSLSLGAGVASAQTPAGPPEITVYHSLDPGGADPRPEAPPGCDWVPGAVTAIGFDELDGGVSVENRYPGITFSTIPGSEVATYDLESFPTSPPNVIVVYIEGGLAANSDVFVDFDPPVDGLQFKVVGDDAPASASITVFFGNEESASLPLPNDGIYATADNVDLSAYPDLTRVSITSITDVGGIGFDDFTWGQPETTECVLMGGPGEYLELWIDGGPTGSNLGAGEELCKKDQVVGESTIPGGSGDELCGAALTLEASGFARFSGFVKDAAMDTLVLGEPCLPVEGDGCTFGAEPPLKLLELNFLRGGSNPPPGPRRLGSLIVDSTGLDPAVNFAEIVASGSAAGAKLQLRDFPLPLGAPPEVVAAIPVPEPGRIVQLLTGVIALAGFKRMRRPR